MHSDKCNLIMAKATGFIFSLINIAFSQDVPIHQLQLASWFYQRAHLCSPFLSSLLHRWKFAVHVLYKASVRDLRKYRASRDTSYEILCLKCYLKCSKQLEMKCNDSSWLCEMPSTLIDSWGIRFNKQAFHVFCNSWIDCRDAFHAVLHLKHCVMGWKSVNTKCTG